MLETKEVGMSLSRGQVICNETSYMPDVLAGSLFRSHRSIQSSTQASL